jgi:hypothetical protein
MTPEEKQLLTDLANKIAQTPAPARDPEAEDFIRTHIGARPDALYLMTQTVLIQNMAIDHANQEIAQLRQQAPASGGSFLGGAPTGQPQYHEQPMQPQYPQQQYQQQQPQYAPPPPQGGGSSFLATAAKTVAGVAAGALAFEGIRSLFHSGGGGGGGFGMPGGSSFLGGGGLMGRQGETIVNNYYDNPESGEQRLDDQAVDDQTYDDKAADDVTDDDQNYDDQAVDDSSDDSGSSDDNSDGLT